MASIEYGIDGYGRKVYPSQALHGRTYTCPYCFGEINVRKCYDKEDYFAHKSIINRTPQQRICPGYTGHGKDGRIEDIVDKVYITNGGLPLYLCTFKNNKYQLNAYFPPLSQESMNKLEKWGTKVVITEKRSKEEYSVENIRFYRVKTIGHWIKVNCKNMKDSIPEVKQKWEWGIRGLDCEKDIFHSYYDGGCRVALHSNIVVGKEYLIVKREYSILSVEGVSFTKKGVLAIKNLYGRCEYTIYAMLVNGVTDEAIAYIQNKGYQLIEKSDEIIPMWPPAVIEGKELIYRKHSNNAFLFHSKRSDQSIFNVSEYGIINVKENENIFETTTNNKTLLLSDYKFNSLSNEIRFILTQTRNNFENEKIYKPNIMCRTDASISKLLPVDKVEIFKVKRIFFKTDIKINICILKKKYVEMSSQEKVGNLKRNRVLIIDIGPFGKLRIEHKAVKKKENELGKIYKNNILENLYHCNSIVIPVTNDILEIFNQIRESQGELYRVMLPWIQKHEIPFMAAKYLYLMKEVIKDDQCKSKNT